MFSHYVFFFYRDKETIIIKSIKKKKQNNNEISNSKYVLKKILFPIEWNFVFLFFVKEIISVICNLCLYRSQRKYFVRKGKRAEIRVRKRERER